MTPPLEVARLIRFSDSDVIARGDGIESVRLTPELAGTGFHHGDHQVPPGTSIRLHTHNTIEQVTVIDGEGLAVIDDEELPARPYDTTQIPAGARHRFINTGTTRISSYEGSAGESSGLPARGRLTWSC